MENPSNRFPGGLSLATLWMITHFKGRSAVVLFNPLSDPTGAAKKVEVLQRLQVDTVSAISAELLIIPQDSLIQANTILLDIPSGLIFAMTWDGRAFVKEN